MASTTTTVPVDQAASAAEPVDSQITLAPPTRVALTSDDRTWKERAKAIIIADADSYKIGGEILLGIKDLRKKIEDHYERIKKPLNALRAAVLRMEHDDLDDVAAAEKDLGDRCAAWFDAEQRRIEAENARQLAEAEAQAKAQRAAEQAAIAEHAETVDDPLVRASLRREQQRLTVEPLMIPMTAQRTVARVAGLSHAVGYGAKVVDLRLLCKAIGAGKVSTEAVIGLSRDRKTQILSSPWLNTEATNRREELSIPGVIAVRKTSSRG